MFVEIQTCQRCPAGQLLTAELDTLLSLKLSKISGEIIIHSYDTGKLVFVEEDARTEHKIITKLSLEGCI